MNSKPKYLPFLLIVSFIILLSASLYYFLPEKPVQKVDLLLKQRMETPEYQQAQKAGVKDMIVCYGNISKKGVIVLNKLPIPTKQDELFENLVIYTNDIKKNNNIIETRDYRDNTLRRIDLGKQVCRIIPVNQ